MVGELNTKVIIKNYASLKDAEGKITSSLITSWGKWAKVEQTSGNRALDNAAITYRESYTITTRYEVSRPTNTKYKIEYRGKDMTIHDVRRDKEGEAYYETITAFTTLQ